MLRFTHPNQCSLKWTSCPKPRPYSRTYIHTHASSKLAARHTCLMRRRCSCSAARPSSPGSTGVSTSQGGSRAATKAVSAEPGAHSTPPVSSFQELRRRSSDRRVTERAAASGSRDSGRGPSATPDMWRESTCRAKRPNSKTIWLNMNVGKNGERGPLPLQRCNGKSTCRGRRKKKRIQNWGGPPCPPESYVAGVHLQSRAE